jgi:hypothetical protein
MFKVTLLVWVMLQTVIAGVTLMTVLLVPGLADQAMSNIPRAVLTGFVVAVPLSYLVARRIAGVSVR